MYYFSVPLPYEKERVDDFFKINKEFSLSKIETLYNSLPTTAEGYTGFEQPRSNIGKNITNIDDFINLIEYTQNLGFQFIYLLNSLQPLDIENPQKSEEKFEKLDILINALKKVGVNKYRVANPQLIYHLNKYYPDIEIYLSISYGYYSIKQFENLLKSLHNVKEIIPAYEQNKNFTLLKNLKTKFPNTNIELMANEGCIQGCPYRAAHLMAMLPQNTKFNKEYISFYGKSCHSIKEEDYWSYICTSGVIYPWQLKEYEQIGINRFKFVGRESILFGTKGYSTFTRMYLKSIEDESYADMLPHNIFSAYLWNGNSPILIKDIKNFLPQIEYFKKHGAECSSKCGVECNYCYKCAEELREKFGN